MYYTYPFAYNTPVPEAFTTIQKCAVLQPLELLDLPEHLSLHMALQTTEEF